MFGFDRDNIKKLILNIEKKGWGKGWHIERKYVLYSAGNTFLDYFPQVAPLTLIIKHADSNHAPVTLYQKGPNGEFQILLSAQDNYWDKYAYQFSHELCHILCKYEKVNLDQKPYNQWFEEAICETASLFVLRQMTLDWQKNAPYKHFRTYAPAFKDYAQRVIDQTDINLSPNIELSQWYQHNEKQLREDYLLRDKERIVAAMLLPLFEETPEHWQAIAFLNEPPFEPAKKFACYLSDWHHLVPEKHKGFVRKIAALFDLSIVE
jgi:hypothetical protein